MIAHNLGFPRIGGHREMKKAIEAYWKGRIDRADLEAKGREIRAANWKAQSEAGLDLVPVGDFSWYDHVLDTIAMVGAIPKRFGPAGDLVDLDTLFRMGRGRAPTGGDASALAMTKWFDTNYHHMVPEFTAAQEFRLASNKLLDEVQEALALGYRVKPVLLGPLSFLWMGKTRGESFAKLTLLERLLPVYADVLGRLAALGVEWAQLDEPILVLDLDDAWRGAFRAACNVLSTQGVKVLMATYFGGLGDNTDMVCSLPVHGLHLDMVRAPNQLEAVLEVLPADRVLSLGVIDGRNIWRTDLDTWLSRLRSVPGLGLERVWLAPSCSLLHVPVDLAFEESLDDEFKSWLAFATQKVREVAVLREALIGREETVRAELSDCRSAAEGRRNSKRIHKPEVQERISHIDDGTGRRNSTFAVRREMQRTHLGLPALPTTTIGSFPQTREIRLARRDFKAGRVDREEYVTRMRAEIKRVVRFQEDVGLDVLVHGEAERNDMVEYFGEQLEGVAFTKNGWVQSYGSRCVKPPVIFGDVSRPAPMTVEWSRYAQSLTDRPMKGMLTGPVTILQWSFVRDDQPRSDTTFQIALALRDEVSDLEAVGIPVIQIDEPAFREGLPLRRGDWADYLDWAVQAFRVASCGAGDRTQIHTHMCYSEFNDTIESIAALDADVISIEASRSGMELLKAFEGFAYPNEIGPGVYDVHSPRVPTDEEMQDLLRKAAARIPRDRLWVNPDCGLKTRDWPETEDALRNMVKVAKAIRDE